MRAPLLVVAVALIAPAALAQVQLVDATLVVSAGDPGMLVPGARTEVPIIVSYTPEPGGRPAPAPTPDRPENTAPTRITLSAKAVPSWVETVTFEPDVLLIYLGVENSTTAQHRRTAIAHINVSAGAPAQQREDFIVLATAEPNGNIGPASAESPSLRLYARAVGVANVTGPASVVMPGGRWSTVEFTVRNDGNAPLVMKLNVTVRPENSQVRFPETLQLNASEARTVPVEVRTPWTNAEFGTLELEAVPIVDGEAATPARAVVDVLGESAVPFSTIVPLAGLLVAVGLFRRRQGPRGAQL